MAVLVVYGIMQIAEDRVMGAKLDRPLRRDVF